MKMSDYYYHITGQITSTYGSKKLSRNVLLAKLRYYEQQPFVEDYQLKCPRTVELYLDCGIDLHQ